MALKFIFYALLIITSNKVIQVRAQGKKRKQTFLKNFTFFLTIRETNAKYISFFSLKFKRYSNIREDA